MKTVDINIFFIVSAIKRYFKIFVVSNIVIVVLAIGVSFMLPVYYESKIVFYPYSPEASDPRTILAEEIFVAVFSDVDQSEKFILMAKARMLRLKLIQKYNLYARYGYDATKPGDEHKLLKTLEENILFRKLENGGVEVSVFDFDRDTAALIANDLVRLLEKNLNDNIRVKNQKLFEVYEKQHNELSTYVNSLKDSLKKVGKNTKVNVALSKQIEFAMEEYTKIKFRYEQSKTIKNYDLKTMMVIEEARPNYVKARPKRMYIVLGAFALGLLFTTTAFSTYEYFRKIFN